MKRRAQFLLALCVGTAFAALATAACNTDTHGYVVPATATPFPAVSLPQSAAAMPKDGNVRA